MIGIFGFEDLSVRSDKRWEGEHVPEFLILPWFIYVRDNNNFNNYFIEDVLIATSVLGLNHT